MSQAASATTGRTMTYEEFLQWAPEGSHLEWVNGKAVEMTPVSDAHGRLQRFLMLVVGGYVEARGLGEVFCEPFLMKTGPELPARSPDLLFIAKANAQRLKSNYLDGPADLVIEIISPGSGSVDRGEKFYEYEEGGVKEYWLLDPHRRRAEFYHLDAEGKYGVMPVAEGVLKSVEIPGLWLKAEWLWPGQMPAHLDVLRAWKLI